MLADARQRFEPGAIRALVANFADAEVGAVSGELALAESEAARRLAEKAPGFTGSTRNSSARTKAGPARRSARPARFTRSAAISSSRSLPDTILDDVLIPMQIVRKGYRVLFEAEARAHDLIAMNPREDFIRKARTIAGTFQLLARHPWMLNPLRCRVWFEVLSHKALRLAIPAPALRSARRERRADRCGLLSGVAGRSVDVLCRGTDGVYPGTPGADPARSNRAASRRAHRNGTANEQRPPPGDPCAEAHAGLQRPLHDVSARLGHDRGIFTDRGPPAAGYLGKDARRTRTARCFAACLGDHRDGRGHGSRSSPPCALCDPSGERD